MPQRKVNKGRQGNIMLCKRHGNKVITRSFKQEINNWTEEGNLQEKWTHFEETVIRSAEELKSVNRTGGRENGQFDVACKKNNKKKERRSG